MVYEDVKASIQDINKNGNVTVKFNQELIDPFDGNKTRLKETNVTSIMKVTFDSDDEAIVFTSSFQEWTSEHVIINLNFTDPLAVSAGDKLDKMLVEILIA